jgi:hypothetical protein
MFMSMPWKLSKLNLMPLLLFALLAVGCDHTSLSSSQIPAESGVPAQSIAESASPSPTPIAIPASTPAATTASGTEHNDAHVSANNTVNGATIPDGTSKLTPKPKVEDKDAYQTEKPTLMGLQIGASKDKVLKLFGKASVQFIMDEDTDAISVYEYTDFSIGFNVKSELEFVDVHTSEIDPGLGGLRLGQSQEDAIRFLGKPDTNTKFVLTYKSQGTVLKLDIDPKENTIQSIKLFANR